MAANYTFDVFTSLDGFGAHNGNWGGYWGKQGPGLLARRLALYEGEQRMVFGATYRAHAKMLSSSTEESEIRDAWVTRMRNLPATVFSTTLKGPLDWPDATVVSGDPSRHRRAAQGGVRCAVVLARQPVVEPSANGRGSRRPRRGHALSCDHGSDRRGPDL